MATFCIDAVQYGQQCSHQLEASAIGTEKSVIQRKLGLESYFVCGHDEVQCGGVSTLEISTAKVVQEQRDVSTWDFQDMEPMFAFCNWQFKVDGLDVNDAEDALV